jgi:hypothetical protein
VPTLCLFCDNKAGSREHLWPAWIMTLHVHPEREDKNIPDPEPKPGDWDNRLMQIWPTRHTVEPWPPKVTFTNGGPRSIATLLDRWRIGENMRLPSKTSLLYSPALTRMNCSLKGEAHFARPNSSAFDILDTLPTHNSHRAASFRCSAGCVYSFCVRFRGKPLLL